MREIKFRVWDTEEGKMHHNVGVQGNCVFGNMEETLLLSAEHNPVMQYTGLKDKLGKEIYDGDIVEYEVSLVPFIKEVYFVEADRNCFVFRQPGNSNGACTYLQTAKLEIIGNIYENPELCPTS